MNELTEYIENGSSAVKNDKIPMNSFAISDKRDRDM